MFIQTINRACLPLAPNEVTQVLDEIATAIRLNHHWRVMKVIHGDGGARRTMSLKNVVRTWADNNRTYFKGIIPGEKYTYSNPTIREMQHICGEFTDPDLGVDNSGVTFILVK